MIRLQEIYKEINDVVDNISLIAEEKKSEGKKVIGIFPPYVPIELVHAAGMFPIGCWGGQASLANAPTFLPAFACSIAQEITELAARGSYSNLDGILISCACDTLKCTGQNLEKICPDCKVIHCRYPQHNTTSAGKEFFYSELEACKSKLEEISGNKITNTALHNSIEIYNKNRKAMIEFTEILSKKPGIVSSVMRHKIIKSRLYMDIENHTEIMHDLNAILKSIDYNPKPCTKIFLSGIMAEPESVLTTFDELNMCIVGDELVQETRQFRNIVPNGLDPLERLTEQWANNFACSFALDIGKNRAKYIAESAATSSADAVVFLQMMFCDVDEFEYPFIKKAISDNQLPIINIEIQQTMNSVEQIKTRLQALCEMIHNK